MMFTTGYCGSLPTYDETLHYKFAATKPPYRLDMETSIRDVEEVLSVAPCLAKQCYAKSISLQDKKVSEDIAPLPLYTPEDDTPPPPYCEADENSGLATRHLTLPKLLRMDSKWTLFLFGEALLGVKEHAQKKRNNNAKKTTASSNKKKGAPEERPNQETPTPPAGSGGPNGGANGGDEEDDKKKKEEEARKKREEEEESAKKKQEEEEVMKKKIVEEEAAAKEEERLRLEEEKRMADDIANNADSWGEPEEEDTGSAWGFFVGGKKRKDTKPKKIAPVPEPAAAPPVVEVAPAPLLVQPSSKEEPGESTGVAETVKEIQKTPKEKERREKAESRKKEERPLRAAGKLPLKSKKEKEVIVEQVVKAIEGPAPPPKERTPKPQGEGSGEVTSPKIDDDIDDNDDNVSPTNKDAPKLSGFSGIGLGWKFGLGLPKWGTNASQATLDTTSPTGSAIGSKKTSIGEAPKDPFPAMKEEGEELIKGSNMVEVVEYEFGPTKDETQEPVMVPQEDPTSPTKPAKLEDDPGYTTKKVKKGNKVDKKPGKVTSLTGVYETEKRKTGKVSSLAGVYEQRTTSIKKDITGRSSKPKSVPIPVPVEVPAESEPEPTPVPAEAEEEDFYGPGYEQVKQRKYADTTQVKYADASNIGYVPMLEEIPYVPVPKEAAYAPVPKGPKYAELKQFEYATPNIWGPGRKGKNTKKVEVTTAPVPTLPPPPEPVVERVQIPESEPVPEPVIQPVVEPELVRPAKRGKKQKKGESWLFGGLEVDPKSGPALEPPAGEAPRVEGAVEVVETIPDPELEPKAEFVGDVAEVVEAEPEPEPPAVVEAELAPAPAPGPELRKARKDASKWGLLVAPKPKKRGPTLEVRMAPNCSLSSTQDIESAAEHEVQADSGVDTVKKQRNERRPSIEIDANGSPVKVVGLRELWKMNKEVEKKKRSARGLSPVEKWQADVVPELPPDNEYEIDKEIQGSSHVDAPWSSDDVPLSPPPPILPIESYLVPDTPIAAQASPPVWKEAPASTSSAPVSRKSSSKKDSKKRSGLATELQANSTAGEPGPEPEPTPQPVKSTKREAKPRNKTWGFFGTVDELEPRSVVEPGPQPVVQALVPEPVIEAPEPEPEPEPIVKPGPGPAKKERKQKKSWFFGAPESEPETEAEPESDPKSEPVRSNREGKKTKKGWLFEEVLQPISVSEQAVSESVPELEPECTEEPEFEQEISAQTPEPSEPEVQFEEAQEEAFAQVQLAIEWPEEKISQKERHHGHKQKGLREVVGVKGKEKHRRRKHSSNTSPEPSSKAPFTERKGTYALSAAPPMERRGTHSSSAPSVERRKTYSSSAPSMERRNTTASTDEAEKAGSREHRRLKKLAEQERLREAEEREKERRHAERRAKKARKEAEAQGKEAKGKERAQEVILASTKPKLERRKSAKKHPSSPIDEKSEGKEARRETRRAKKIAKESSAGTGSGSHKRHNRHSISHAAQLFTTMNGVPYPSPDAYPNGKSDEPCQDAYEQEALIRRRREHHNAKRAQKAGIWTNGEALSGSVTPERVPSEEVNGVHFSSSTSQDLRQEEALRERRRRRKEARRSLHETVIDDEEAKRLRKIQKKEEKRAMEMKESGSKEPKSSGDKTARRAQKESDPKEPKNSEDKAARRAQRESGAKELKNPEDRAARRMQRAKRRADSERFNGALTENESAPKGSWWKRLLG